MDSAELLGILSRGEDTRHQFKENVTHAKSVGAELAAFANGLGGFLLIGISDNGEVVGLTNEDVRRINSLIANAASHNVRPAVDIITENLEFDGRIIVVVTVPPGTNRPYFDCDGAIWQRVGPDKRRLHSREELRRFFQDCGLLQADAIPILGVRAESVERRALAKVMRRIGEPPPRSDKAAWAQMERMGLVRADQLTFAGLLLFGKHPQRVMPQFSLKAVYFSGEDETSTSFLDSEDYEGRLPDLYSNAFAFLRRNLRKVQNRRSVNARGGLEVPESVLEELLCNALLHRDYLIDAPIRLLLFDDRIEIVNPGPLIAGLTIDSIKRGSSYIRNPLLTSFAVKGMLPYRGLGTGIRRVMRTYAKVDFDNDPETRLFRAIVRRPSSIENGQLLPSKPLSGERGANDKLFRTMGRLFESVRGNIRPDQTAFCE